MTAQVDVSPPLPNVLLLVDTSGSMEYNLDGTKVTCSRVDASLPAEPSGTAQKSRWVQLVEVLTGDIVGYSCWTQDRRSSPFRNEYLLGSTPPPDYNYLVPHHRILYPFAQASGSSAFSTEPCTVGPGIADSNVFAWGSTPFRYRVWNDATKPCAPPTQSGTGLLDAFADRARFALMTFDSQTNAGTGVGLGTTADYPSGVAGSWSYFLNWRDNPGCPIDGTGNPFCALGKPAGCRYLSQMEVGARNSAAPPWEGRMMPFGRPSASLTEVHQNTGRIKQVLLGTRPFGATPINGMLADARDFLTADGSTDPNASGGSGCGQDPETCFGPKDDPFVTGRCRKSFIILLTDGEPNLDLRPSCVGGKCPYEEEPEQILKGLAHPTSGAPPIRTFVVGFALSTVDLGGGQTPVDCSTLSQHYDLYCGTGMNPKLAACCTLAKLAVNGDTTSAHFATNASELRSALSDILSEIASVATSRTVPVYGSAAGTVAKSGSYTFYSSFVVAAGQMWRGSLTRKRTTCESVTQSNGTSRTEPVVQDVSKDAGDDFAYNVNNASSDSTHPRHYYTVIAASDGSGNVRSTRSIRPALTSDPNDGAGILSGALKDGTDSTFPTNVSAKAMNILQSACSNPSASSDDDCAQRIMKWEIGVANGTLPSRAGNVLGDIYHATPVLVGPPSDSLRDESYTAYAAAYATRPVVLYAATNDGQLHAFKVAAVDPSDSFKVDRASQNELWSFFPPAVLPKLITQYPSSHQLLLDSPPVVMDVVFTRDQQSAISGGNSSDWHTVLVEGFGAGGGGYFAVDITQPVPKSGDTNTGPRFLWQLTTDSSGARLFGTHSGIPAITTLYFTAPGQNEQPKEHAVAILPGGSSDAATSGSCPQQGTSTLVDSVYPPRDKVQCYANDPARSVTIVLLETGEIVRTFRSTADGPSALVTQRGGTSGQLAALDAPMTGQPVVYPAQTGAVADRAFIGDSDGMIWRLDLASTDPNAWAIKLWFDAYNKTVMPSSSGTLVPGQPIASAPVLSIDTLGNVTMAFATGDQESFNYVPGMKNFFYSLKEKADTFKSELQWYSSYNDGARVSGPIQIYSSVLYYTTVTPQPATDRTHACQAGSSSLCAVDYLVPQGSATSGNGGAAALPGETNGDAVRQCKALGDTVAFGAAILKTPTCTMQETYTDPYLGLPNHLSLRSGVTGGGSSVVVNGSSTTAGTTQPQIALPTPTRTTRIDSWATIID